MHETIFLGMNLLGKILDQLQEEARRKHERKLQELSTIANSAYRDRLAAELLMDKLLAPIEEAQYRVQDTAKHAQYMAEIIGYHYKDHQLTEEQARELGNQFRLLAIKLTEAESLYDLKLLYGAATLFVDKISIFKHRERKYSIEYEVRHNILDPLNACIAQHANFQRRISLFESIKSDAEQ